jgi:hypothetical protein
MVREGFKRNLTAIHSAYVEEHYRLMDNNWEGTVRRLMAP